MKSLTDFENRRSVPSHAVGRRLGKALTLGLCAALSISTTSAHAATIDMVTIGNPGNAPDTRYVAAGIGSVDHVYRMGKYEVTALQYTEFLNAVAKADPNALYNTNMAVLANKGCNILRTGDSPNYSYSVAADWADMPVNIVSFWDAVRFANWLHNGQPSGSQGPGTTEDGAYHNVGNDTLFGRNAGARFFIPNASEWYKAAFHDKAAGLAASYFNYPTSNNTAPGKDPTETTNPGNNANHDDLSAQGAPYHRTVVGEYELSASPYGTFDQAGNVYEWSETEIKSFASLRELRGGSFYDGYSVLSPSATLRASNQSFNTPTSHFNNVGFRVASIAIPEPSSLPLAALAVAALFWRRRSLLCASILAVAVGISFADRAAADTFGSGANTFDIEFVTIGNPGNAADTTGSPNPAGSVPYTFRMGKFEISEQMIDKANAEGGLAITKNTRGADKPATSVSWNQAARFVNWLNTSSGSTPAYKFAIQPGEAGYIQNANIELWTISDAGYNPNNPYRNSMARYFLPSVHEWYKAAYYDPTSGVYYNYPTGSDSAPTAVASGTTAGTAVYGGQSLVTGPANITLAGGLSPYGAMGQGGNVEEWEETDVDLVNGPTLSSSARGIRGGSWVALSSNVLLTSDRTSVVPTGVIAFVGFRVASVSIPEPSSLTLLAATATLRRRRGRRDSVRSPKLQVKLRR